MPAAGAAQADDTTLPQRGRTIVKEPPATTTPRIPTPPILEGVFIQTRLPPKESQYDTAARYQANFTGRLGTAATLPPFPPLPPEYEAYAPQIFGKPMVTYHVCRICMRPRSDRYHREHPIAPYKVPPPPGICRRCRVVGADERLENAEIIRVEESGPIRIGIESLIPDEDILTLEQVKEEMGRRRRVHGHVRVLREVRSSSRPKEDTKNVRVIYRHVTAKDRPPVEEDVASEHLSVENLAALNRLKSNDEAVKEVAKVQENNEPPRQTIAFDKIPIEITVRQQTEPQSKASPRLGTIEPDDRHQEVAELPKQTIAFDKIPIEITVRQQAEQPVKAPPRSGYSESDIRRLAREEVVRYRQAERSMEAHPGPYSYGRWLPLQPQLVDRTAPVSRGTLSQRSIEPAPDEVRPVDMPPPPQVKVKVDAAVQKPAKREAHVVEREVKAGSGIPPVPQIKDDANRKKKPTKIGPLIIERAGEPVRVELGISIDHGDADRPKSRVAAAGEKYEERQIPPKPDIPAAKKDHGPNPRPAKENKQDRRPPTIPAEVRTKAKEDTRSTATQVGSHDSRVDDSRSRKKDDKRSTAVQASTRGSRADDNERTEKKDNWSTAAQAFVYESRGDDRKDSEYRSRSESTPQIYDPVVKRVTIVRETIPPRQRQDESPPPKRHRTTNSHHGTGARDGRQDDSLGSSDRRQRDAERAASLQEHRKRLDALKGPVPLSARSEVDVLADSELPSRITSSQHESKSTAKKSSTGNVQSGKDRGYDTFHISDESDSPRMSDWTDRAYWNDGFPVQTASRHSRHAVTQDDNDDRQQASTGSQHYPPSSSRRTDQRSRRVDNDSNGATSKKAATARLSHYEDRVEGPRGRAKLHVESDVVRLSGTESGSTYHTSTQKHTGKSSSPETYEYEFREYIKRPVFRPEHSRSFDDHEELLVQDSEALYTYKPKVSKSPAVDNPAKRAGLSSEPAILRNSSLGLKTSTASNPIAKKAGLSSEPAILRNSSLSQAPAGSKSSMRTAGTSNPSARQDSGKSTQVRFAQKVHISPTPPASDEWSPLSEKHKERSEARRTERRVTSADIDTAYEKHQQRPKATENRGRLSSDARSSFHTPDRRARSPAAETDTTVPIDQNLKLSRANSESPSREKYMLEMRRDSGRSEPYDSPEHRLSGYLDRYGPYRREDRADSMIVNCGSSRAPGTVREV